MRNLFVAFALIALLFALCPSAEAQQPAKLPRVGFLSATSPSTIAARTDAFRQGLRELGYVEGKALSLTFAMRKGKSSACLRLQPSWYG
jgi:hypothetical protein